VYAFTLAWVRRTRVFKFLVKKTLRLFESFDSLGVLVTFRIQFSMTNPTFLP
jgi:hypothetical protein